MTTKEEREMGEEMERDDEVVDLSGPGRNKNGRISKKALGWMGRHQEVIKEFFYRDHPKVTGAEYPMAVIGGKLELPLTEIIFTPKGIEFRFYTGMVAETIEGKNPIKINVGGKIRRIDGLVKGQCSSIMPGDTLMVYWHWWSENWFTSLRRKIWDRLAVIQDMR